MKNISNIEDLRTHAIETLEKLRSKKIDIEEAGVTGKLYENIISSLKTQIEYNKMVGHANVIPFLHGEKEVKGRLLKSTIKSIGKDKC